MPEVQAASVIHPSLYCIIIILILYTEVICPNWIFAFTVYIRPLLLLFPNAQIHIQQQHEQKNEKLYEGSSYQCNIYNILSPITEKEANIIQMLNTLFSFQCKLFFPAVLLLHHNNNWCCCRRHCSLSILRFAN